MKAEVAKPCRAGVPTGGPRRGGTAASRAFQSARRSSPLQKKKAAHSARPLWIVAQALQNVRRSANSNCRWLRLSRATLTVPLTERKLPGSNTLLSGNPAGHDGSGHITLVSPISPSGTSKGGALVKLKDSARNSSVYLSESLNFR